MNMLGMLHECPKRGFVLPLCAIVAKPLLRVCSIFVSQYLHKVGMGYHREITKYEWACQRLADLTEWEVEYLALSPKVADVKLAEALLDWLERTCFRKVDDLYSGAQ